MFFVERKLDIFSGKILKYPLCAIGIVAFSFGVVSGIKVKAQLTKRFWSRVGSLGTGYLRETNRLMVIRDGLLNRRNYLEAIKKASINKSRELTAYEKMLVLNSIQQSNDAGSLLKKVVEQEFATGEPAPIFYHLLGSRWKVIEKAFDEFDGKSKDVITTDNVGNRVLVSGVNAPLLERVSIIGFDESTNTGQRVLFTVTRENKDKVDLYSIFKEGLKGHPFEQSEEVGFVLVFNKDITEFGSVRTNLPGVLLSNRDIERKIFRTSSSYEEAIYRIGANDANNLAGDGTMPDWSPITSKRLQNYAQGRSSESGLIKLYPESDKGKSFFDSLRLNTKDEKQQSSTWIKSYKDSLSSSDLKIYKSELHTELKSGTKKSTKRVVKRLRLNETK